MLFGLTKRQLVCFGSAALVGVPLFFLSKGSMGTVSYTHLDVYKRQEYGLEQVYNVIDSRYRSRKPLIVTTNLTLDSLQNPQDTAHARIDVYKRQAVDIAPKRSQDTKRFMISI